MHELAKLQALVDVFVHVVDGKRVADAAGPTFRRFKLWLAHLCRGRVVKPSWITVSCAF